MLEKYKKLMTTKEVAEVLRVHPQTVLRMKKRGDFEATYESKPNLFAKKDIINFIQKGGVDVK